MTTEADVSATPNHATGDAPGRGAVRAAATFLTVALLAAGGGCATAAGGAAPSREPAPEASRVPDLQQRGLLLLMADQERFEPFVVETALQGDAALRELLAAALGRAGDARGASYLAQLLADPALPVRRAAAFAMGELELEREAAERAARGLLLAAAEPDADTGLLAVEALGKLGVSVTAVLGALSASELAEEERWRRLLPPLYRFEEAAQVAVAEAGLAAAADPEMRRWAAYALTRTPRPEALPRIRDLLTDPDPRVRAWAARAVGMVGEAGNLARLAPLVEEATAGGEVPDYADLAPAIQAVRAAAALVERLGAEAAEAAPAASAGGERAPPPAQLDLAGWPERLASLLDHPEPHLRLEAIDRAAPFLVAPGAEALREALLGHVVAAQEVAAPPPAAGPADPDEANGSAAAGGALAGDRGGEADAAETAAAGTGRPAAGEGDDAAASSMARDAVVAEGAAALVALASGDDDPLATAAAPPAASPLVDLSTLAAESPNPLLRAAAATAAGRLGAPDLAPLLDRLLDDPAAAVRSAAAAALLALLEPLPEDPAAAPSETAVLAGRLLAAADSGVRAAAFSWLAEHPVVPYSELTRALQAELGNGDVESLLQTVPAIAARGAAVAAERGGVVAVLENLAARDLRTDTAWLLRRAAAEALVTLDRPAPPVGHPRGRRGPAVYEAIAERTARPRDVEMVTAAGTLRLRLDCPAAPLTCLNFLQLAGQGFFDGVPFHRVVPDFVVQGGDPRGDGLGGPGYAIRDEINRRRFTAGTLGMARAGPDTAGSQFFLTLAPQPHLDGAYTAFGEVVAGAEVLPLVTRGTRVFRVRELP
jgi:cyclophilin family peptidyl-prolyl cis-trans isomerase/HEAT repeat protein